MTTAADPSTVNIAATRRIYEAVPAGDLDTVLALLDPEVVVEYIGTDAIPFAGRYERVEGAVEFFTRVGTSVEVVSVEPRLFIADGDHLAVWGHIVLRTHEGGVEIPSDFAHIITLRDGRWLHFRDFANSALTAEAFSGRG